MSYSHIPLNCFKKSGKSEPWITRPGRWFSGLTRQISFTPVS